MKATLEGKIEHVHVTKESIVLDVDFNGKDQLGRVASGHVKLVIANSLPNGRMQIGRTIQVTVTDGEEGAT